MAERKSCSASSSNVERAGEPNQVNSLRIREGQDQQNEETNNGIDAFCLDGRGMAFLHFDRRPGRLDQSPVILSPY